MVVAFHINADISEDRRDRVADVDQRVERSDRNVTFFRADVIAIVQNVAALAAAVPMPFFGIDEETGRVLVVVIASLVKDEELGFRPDVDRIGDAGEFQIALSTHSDRTRIEPVTFFRDRIDCICEQTKRSVFGKRIDPESRWIRHEQHVRFMDRRPASKRGSVKSKSVLKAVLGQLTDRECKMMPGTDKIGKPDRNKPRLILSGIGQNTFGVHILLLGYEIRILDSDPSFK